MRSYAWLLLVWTTPLMAQTVGVDARKAAGCGPAQAQFEVNVTKTVHELASPVQGKSRVYLAVQQRSNPPSSSLETVTTRVGLDGEWVGANHGDSYASFDIEPGTHRLCSDSQSNRKALQPSSGTVSFTAEAGKTYYFLAAITRKLEQEAGSIRLRQVELTEGLLLVSKSGKSAWVEKKIRRQHPA